MRTITTLLVCACSTFKVLSLTYSYPTITTSRQPQSKHDSLISGGHHCPTRPNLSSKFFSRYDRGTMNLSNQIVNQGDTNNGIKLSLYRKIGYKIGATTSTVVSLTFFSILAYKRDAYMITFFIGSILNGICSKILKKVINQERPISSDESLTSIKPSDKGMPSSHAMSLGFIGTFTILTILFDYKMNGSTTPSMTVWLHDVGKASSVSLVILYCVVSLWYRTAAQLHTVDQVLVGLGLGISNAIAWRFIGFTHGWPLGQGYTVKVNDWVLGTLPKNGHLPLPYLFIPALVGLAVVGSFERRISSWIRKSKKL